MEKHSSIKYAYFTFIILLALVLLIKNFYNSKITNFGPDGKTSKIFWAKKQTSILRKSNDEKKKTRLMMSPINVDKLRYQQIQKTCQKMMSESVYHKNYIQEEVNLLTKTKTDPGGTFIKNLKPHSKIRFKSWYYGGGDNHSDNHTPTYMFCTPPKSGTTNWQRLLRRGHF